ncbi:hypothetical protein [Bartonella tribocorum]|uniref:hypothetical protein n=1 Tax=Bartonella tribocorum TaxID=85701 RepID=UPI00043AE136|nr:hypothetical protein [Bartonella tribocorum]CDO48646.1 virulence-associated protein E [Bartonella tribocorum]CDO48667.1 virulence-associated protein E [Bartonella tribocorum]CDO48701.1 virulence-associated protein E [Bartonella tribocorum]
MMCSFKNAWGITRALRGVWHGCYGSQPIKKTLADFTFATRAYSQAFEVLMRQTPHNAYLTISSIF